MQLIEEWLLNNGFVKGVSALWHHPRSTMLIRVYDDGVWDFYADDVVDDHGAHGTGLANLQFEVAKNWESA